MNANLTHSPSLPQPLVSPIDTKTLDQAVSLPAIALQDQVSDVVSQASSLRTEQGLT